MGEIADLILSGDVCQLCMCELGEGDGYPRSCEGCGDDGFAKRRQDAIDGIMSRAVAAGWHLTTHNDGFHTIAHRQGVYVNIWTPKKAPMKWLPKGNTGSASRDRGALLSFLEQKPEAKK